MESLRRKLDFQLLMHTEGSGKLNISMQLVATSLDLVLLPLEPRHRCTNSLPSSCVRNDVLASRLLTEHTSADVGVLFIASTLRNIALDLWA